MKESGEGFCRRGRGRPIHVEGLKTEKSRRPTVEILVLRLQNDETGVLLNPLFTLRSVGYAMYIHRLCVGGWVGGPARVGAPLGRAWEEVLLLMLLFLIFKKNSRKCVHVCIKYLYFYCVCVYTHTCVFSICTFIVQLCVT